MKSDPAPTPKRQVNLRNLLDTAALIGLFLACAWVVVELATGGPTGILCQVSRFACPVLP